MKARKFAVSLLAAGLMVGAHAATLSEGFTDVSTLAASGWVLTNSSSPVGLSWFQGDNTSVFAAQSGPASSYVGASFLSTSSDTGVVDNWLISPLLTATGGSTLSFYTRTADAGFSDALQVLFSAGSSTSTSSFTTLRLTVGGAANPYSTTGWTLYTAALPTASTGRFAFRYTVANALDADYIGIDTVNVTTTVAAPVPEPATLALFGVGLAVVAVARRRKSI